ncbi:hypothetical protein JOC75_004041 [Metabacillus crassostreae]|nr:hypothetical protein [Metabacillus crassostreae]
MNLTKFSHFLYRVARLIGDVNAAKKGTLHKRITNRTLKKFF